MTKRRESHTLPQVESILAELDAQTDRGKAIIASAVIEDLLALVVQRRLRPLSSKMLDTLFGGKGPLGSFSNLIDIGTALGLYNEAAANQLHMLREIRNKFAHRMDPIGFADPEIIEIIKKRTNSNPAPMKHPEAAYMALFRIMGTLLYMMDDEEIKLSPVWVSHPQIYKEYEKASEILTKLSMPETPAPSPAPSEQNDSTNS